ncbi:hypothetical protein Bca101_091139 [Brassica carinata]
MVIYNPTDLYLWEGTIMKVAFGGLDSVSQPPHQPDRPEGSKSTQKGVTENALVVGPILHPKGLRKMLEDMEKDFEGGQEADKLGGGGSKSGGSLASGTLGLEWKRSKLLCVIGRRQRWSTRFDGVGRGVVRF